MLIVIGDITAAGYCVSGARGWFARYGLNFRDFCKNGIDADALLATGDGMAQTVVKRKIEREALDAGVDLSTLLITAADLRASGGCVDGAKSWGGANGFDFRDFVRSGIPADQLMATGDPEARAVVLHKLERLRHG